MIRHNRLNPRIYIWIPDYTSATGGIQVFPKFLVGALADWYTIFLEARGLTNRGSKR